MEQVHSHRDSEVHEHKHQDNNLQQEKAQAEQEKMVRLSMFEQQARQIQQQLEMLDQQIIELQLLRMNLDDLKKAEIKDEILASIGRNIFIKTALESKELLVDIGAKTVVKKSIDEIKELIDKDISSLSTTREKIMEELNQLAAEIQGE